jgi:hypothetical protein
MIVGPASIVCRLIGSSEGSSVISAWSSLLPDVVVPTLSTSRGESTVWRCLCWKKGSLASESANTECDVNSRKPRVVFITSGGRMVRVRAMNCVVSS